MGLSQEDIRDLLDKILEIPAGQKWGGGKIFLTKKGVKVRSKIEKIIADFYFDKGVNFEYEKRVVFPKMSSSEKYTLFCDFYLPDFGVYHEHFGMDDEDYIRLSEIKKKAFRRFKMKFISTSIEDECDIEKAISEKLKDLGFEI